MFETEFKLKLKHISQLLPSKNCFYKIYPLTGKPKKYEELNILDRDLKVQDRVYFQFENNWYELVCLRSWYIKKSKPALTPKEEAEILRKQKEIYEQLGGNY